MTDFPDMAFQPQLKIVNIFTDISTDDELRATVMVANINDKISYKFIKTNQAYGSAIGHSAELSAIKFALDQVNENVDKVISHSDIGKLLDPERHKFLMDDKRSIPLLIKEVWATAAKFKSVEFKENRDHDAYKKCHRIANKLIKQYRIVRYIKNNWHGYSEGLIKEMRQEIRDQFGGQTTKEQDVICSIMVNRFLREFPKKHLNKMLLDYVKFE